MSIVDEDVEKLLLYAIVSGEEADARVLCVLIARRGMVVWAASFVGWAGDVGCGGLLRSNR
jgi:hypothetical protein